jgi:predicted HTH transcriptional regulator
MELKYLKDLVSDGEGQLLEFKKKATFPEKIVREMVAFANSNGGTLLVGVDDNGTISGLKFADEDQFVIDRAIAQHIKPAIRYKSQIIPISGKRSVLSYQVFESRRKPNYYLENPPQRGNAYVRIKDKSVKASPELVQILNQRNRKEGVKIYYGNEEKLLLKYLDEHDHITLDEFVNISGLSRSKASRLLVRLVVANILQVQVEEQGDFYTTKHIY